MFIIKEFFMLNKDHHTKKGTPIDYIYVDARRFVADDKLIHNNVLYLNHPNDRITKNTPLLSQTFSNEKSL